jgi:transcriptional regulator with GAF, ATPase, and Fis domain
MRPLCLQICGSNDDARITAVKAALGARGIAVVTPAASDGCAAVVLCVTRADVEVFDAIRTCGADGAHRVLVLALESIQSRHTWTLLEHGASDVIPFVGSVQGAAEAIAVRAERWAETDALVAADVVQGNLVGQSAVWIATLRQLVELARYADAPCLLGGETGTGKELAARLIHTLDERPRKGSLVLVDCTTLTPELTGSELFGHERGAFTGAVTARDGACALADGGTLFLDEIGELPLRLQSELLRVLQEGTYKRVGSDHWRQTRFRLVCATNRQLPDEVAAGRFRSDLYYRIAGISCRLPSLRERCEDVMPLVAHFIKALCPSDSQPPAVEEAVADYLMTREYPGNVRELRQLVVRIMARHAGSGPITAGDLPADERPCAAVVPADWRDDGFVHGIRRALAQGVRLPEIGRAAEEVAIRIALGENRSIRHAALRLGVTDRALQLRRNGRRRPGDADSRG